MRKVTLLLLVLTCILQATAQDKTVAQLKKELDEHPQQDAQRVDKLNDLSLNVFLSFDERKKLSEEAVSTAQKINYTPGEAYALANLGYYRAADGKAKEGDSLLKRADSLAQKSGDPNLVGVVFFRIGAREINLGNTEAGMSHLFKAEEIFEKANNYKRLAHCQAAIANYYQINFSNYPAAMEYLLKASESAEKANTPEMFFKVWNGLSNLYFYLGDFENALGYLKKAQEELKKAGVDMGKTTLFNDLGEIYRLTGKYPEAIQAYNQALEADRSASSADIYESNLADVYTRMNNLPLAFQYGFSSLTKAQQLG